MDIKTLMIGDWVYNKHHGKNIRLTPYDFFTHTHNEFGEQELAPFAKPTIGLDLEPIPLTPEILEKNGFENVLDEYGTECYRYYNSAADGYIKISLYNGGDGDWNIEIVNYEKFNDNEIVYNNTFIFLKVHELQHALKLCGIEKEIEL